MQYEQNMMSPRFGQPTMYRITLNDPAQPFTGVGLPLSSVEVHYSRIVHLVDNSMSPTSSEIFGSPRMRPVLNNLIDLQKIYGACGEGYWKGAFATLAAETHPQLGGDVELDVTAMREQMKKWRDSLDRVLAATGVTWKTISPTITDPQSYVQNEIQAICVKLGCPLRIFMGSEQGVLAASQDAIAWMFRVRERRTNYLTPKVIVPLIDRLIVVGVLPTPERYSVGWDDAQRLTPMEEVQVSTGLTQAAAAYISGQVDQIWDPMTWLVEIVGWDQDRAKAAVKTAMEHINRQAEFSAVQGAGQFGDQFGSPFDEEQGDGGQFGDEGEFEEGGSEEFGEDEGFADEGNEFGGEGSDLQEDDGFSEQLPEQAVGAGAQEGPLSPEVEEARQKGLFDEEGNYIGDEVKQGLLEPNLPAEGELPEEQMEGEEQLEGQQPQGEVDEESGMQIDPETGYLVDEETGYLVDKESGDVYNPETGQVEGNIYEETNGEGDEEELGEPEEGVEEMEGPDGAVDPTGLDDEEGEEAEDFEQDMEGEPLESELGEEPEVGDESVGEVDELDSYPVDPETGMTVHPETGYLLDRETGNVYTPDGEYYKNIYGEGDETRS
jgi:hypothetical protein